MRMLSNLKHHICLGVTALLLSAAFAPASEQGDAISGEFVFSARCASCHAAGISTSSGPALGKLMNSRAGARADFPFSAAMAKSNMIWTAETLNRFMADPLAAFPGSNAGVCAITDAADRSDVAAFLATY